MAIRDDGEMVGAAVGNARGRGSAPGRADVTGRALTASLGRRRGSIATEGGEGKAREGEGRRCIEKQGGMYMKKEIRKEINKK